MNNLKKITVWLLATGVVLAAAAMLIPRKAVAAIAAQVFVTNSSLPVTGNVGITGTPMVQLAPDTSVMVSGTPTVQLAPDTSIMISRNSTVRVASDTPIMVGNFPTEQVVRDKDNPALAPFSTFLCKGGGSNGGNNPCGNPSSYTVGPNQRLVIEYVSVSCIAVGGSVVFEDGLQTTGGGGFGLYSFPPGQTNGMGASIANQQVRIYADPGTTVLLGVGGEVGPTPGVSFFRCTATLSGNLVTP